MAIVVVKDGNDAQWIEQLQKYERSMRERSNVAVEHSFQNAKMLWQGKDWWEYERTV